jgi:hypothetical protein
VCKNSSEYKGNQAKRTPLRDGLSMLARVSMLGTNFGLTKYERNL